MTADSTVLTYGDNIKIEAAPDDIQRVERFLGFLATEDKCTMLERSTNRLQLLATYTDIPSIDDESPLYYDVIIWNALKKAVVQ